MKHRIILLLLFIMLLTVFNGCGGNKKTETTEPWEIASNLKPVELTVYLPEEPSFYSHYYGKELLDYMPKELNKRLKVINAKIKIGNVGFATMPLRAVIETTYQEAIASGKKMDLYFINLSSARGSPSEALENTIRNLGEKKYAADLTDIASKLASKYYKNFEKKELDMLSYKGKLLAIPSLNYPSTRRTVAVVREDLMKAYKLKPIKSMEDYENYLQTIKMNERNLIPMLFGGIGATFSNVTYDLFGKGYEYIGFNYMNANIVYRLSDPEMKLVPWEQTGEFFELAKKIRTWKLKGYAVDFWMPDMHDVTSGKYASFISESGSAVRYNRALEGSGGKAWKYAEYDLFPESLSVREFNPFSLICVNPRSPNKERAVMLIDLLMKDQKSYDIFTCGVENKDFSYNSKNIPKPKVPTGYLMDYDSYMPNNVKWCLSNIFMQHEEEQAVKDMLKAAKEKTVFAPDSGFMIDRDPLEKALNGVDLQTGYRSTNTAKISKGELSEVEIQEYINRTKPGMEVLTKELQRQLDEWRLGQKK